MADIFVSYTSSDRNWAHPRRAGAPGLVLSVVIAVALGSTSYATDLLIKDGDTLKLNGTIYRLDGIDAPELDQVCLDENGAVWTCGIDARDRLSTYIGMRTLRCDDKGADTAYRKRRIGICSVEGEMLSLNQWLVREGLALNFDRFQLDQDGARQNRRGFWKGCLVAPWDLRYWRKGTAPLLGSCPDAATARNALFPDHAEMPPGCSLKGHIAVRARVTGYPGIYHLEGCRSYRTVHRVNRWFCSEEDAWASGFRKAFTCPRSP
jgi:endonuclease YncB( thermonuclease family)